MKTRLRLALLLAFIYLLVAFAVRGQDTIRFSTILTTNDVPVDFPIWYLHGKGSFSLSSGILSYNFYIADSGCGAWTARFGPTETNQDTTGFAIILPVTECFAPLPPSRGSTVWRGTVPLSGKQVRLLVCGQIQIVITDGGFFPPGFAVEGRIFLDNNQNGIPDDQDDTDHDGVVDTEDQCPNTPAGQMVNSRGCSVVELPQLCPCEGRWTSHGQYVECVKDAARGFVEAGLLNRAQGQIILREAARADCGKK